MKETFFLVEVDVTNKKRVFSRSCHTVVFCKNFVEESFFSLLAWKRLKKRILHRCFLLKLSEHLFHRTPGNSLTIIFNFVENIWNFGTRSNLKTYLEHIPRKKYVVCKSQSRNWSHAQGNLLKSRVFYIFFLNMNVISFCFHFLQRMLSHPSCYLKSALLKARKPWIFKIFPLRPTLSARRL